MKTTKKLLAMLLALTMILSLAVAVHAEDDDAHKITVSNAQAGVKYTIHQMLTLKYTNNKESYVYVSTSDWVNFWTSENLSVGTTTVNMKSYFDINSENVVTLKSNYQDDAATLALIAQAAKTYATNKTLTGESHVASESDGKVEVSFENVVDGYYLLVSTPGTYSAMGTVAGADLTLREKNTLPQIKKENVTNGSIGIGDTAKFKITVTTEENIQNAKHYVIHDKMGNGLTLVDGYNETTKKNASIIVKHNDSALTEGEDYTITKPGDTCADGCTFEIVFTKKLTTKAYDTITVEYSATVNANATSANTTNTAWLNDETIDTEKIYTYQFTLKKIAKGTDTVLPGAQFELYSDSSCTQKISLIKDGDAYRPATTGETPASYIEAGEVVIRGLATGTYYLKEIKAPGGYIKQETTTTVTLTDDKNNANNEAGSDGLLDTNDGTLTIKVENSTGSTLPETGGMGTTIFYVLGGILMLAAVVVLVSKKRMTAE